MSCPRQERGVCRPNNLHKLVYKNSNEHILAKELRKQVNYQKKCMFRRIKNILVIVKKNCLSTVHCKEN
jgi:hypothetical protein